MRKTALVRRAALTASIVLFGFLSSLEYEPQPATVRNTDPYPPGTEVIESLLCNNCGKIISFWAYYIPEYADGGRSLTEDNVVYSDDDLPDGGRATIEAAAEGNAYTGYHWRISMCLNCGAINGDLPANDHGFWQNVFRLEPCPAEHSIEVLSYEAVDVEYHDATILDTARCPMCGEGREDSALILEKHVYTPEVIDPACLSGGYTVYACERCGGRYQGDETEAAGHRFGDWILDREPTVDNVGSHHRECLVCGEMETEPLPRLEAEPELEPGPEPGPTPESKPELASILHNAYISGLPDGTFEPFRPISRAEAAAIFAGLLAEEREKTVPAEKYTFIDVPVDAWYADQVDCIASLGVIQGRGDGRFAPNDPITRSEFAVMTVRAFGTYGGQTENMLKYTVFPDIPYGHWAAQAIQSAAELGWFSGDENGLFHPDDPVLRAEGVAVLNRILRRQADRAYIVSHLTELKTFTDIDPSYWAWYDIIEASNAHTAFGQQESWSR